jgi:O-antigen/teichoic acid export membrane protein
MLQKKIKSLFAGRVFRNMTWLGGAELVNRIFRLATSVTLARSFSPKEYGLMAILYISLDFAFLFTQSGTVKKIIQVEEDLLQITCDTCYWINWITCIAAFSIQCLLAYPISLFFGSTDLFFPLCFCALTYLIFPFFLIKASLIERDNRMKEVAVIHTTQAFMSSLLTIVLVVLSMGVWSIALSMFFSTLIWLMVNTRITSWTPPKKITFKEWRPIVIYIRSILGSDFLYKLRSNLDYLIVLKFLGGDLLGFYYFAFNAGSGITMNIVNTFIWALYPHLCNIRTEPQQFKREYFKNLKVIMLSISTVVILQASLSYFYVPIFFGETWVSVIPILVLICISVIPISLKLLGSILLNASNKPEVSLRFDVLYTIVFAFCLLLVVQHGIYWVAFSVLICHTFMGILFSILSSTKVFGSSKIRI